MNSTALAVLRESEIEEMVFIDHGGDYPYTYDYVKYMIKQGFPITVVKPDVEGFDNLPDFCESKRVFPNRLFRWCTDKFKIRTLRKYYKSSLPIRLYVGFCAGEEKRVKTEFRFSKGIYASYPLIQMGVDREGCVDVIEEAGLKVPCRSCCWFCFNANREELKRLRQDYPDLWLRRKDMREADLRRWAETKYIPLTKFIDNKGETR